MFTSALSTQCLIGSANGSKIMRVEGCCQGSQFAKPSTTPCGACPQGALFPAQTPPVTPLYPQLSGWRGRASPVGTASREHSHAQLWEMRPHSSGVPSQTGRDDIRKNLLFMCKRPFLFSLPFHNPHLSLSTSDSTTTCTPKKETMITADLDNIMSLMPGKPLVCLLRAVSGWLQLRQTKTWGRFSATRSSDGADENSPGWVRCEHHHPRPLQINSMGETGCSCQEAGSEAAHLGRGVLPMKNSCSLRNAKFSHISLPVCFLPYLT